MRIERLFRLALLALGGLGLATTAAVAESWDVRLRRLCTSTTQDACWIKAGAELCDAKGRACRELVTGPPARVLRKSGRRWEVETREGRGWVNERFMMVDGGR